MLSIAQLAVHTPRYRFPDPACNGLIRVFRLSPSRDCSPGSWVRLLMRVTLRVRVRLGVASASTGASFQALSSTRCGARLRPVRLHRRLVSRACRRGRLGALGGKHGCVQVRAMAPGFHGRCAPVTGAGRGIGRMRAREIVAGGACLAIGARGAVTVLVQKALGFGLGGNDGAWALDLSVELMAMARSSRARSPWRLAATGPNGGRGAKASGEIATAAPAPAASRFPAAVARGHGAVSGPRARRRPRRARPGSGSWR